MRKEFIPYDESYELKKLGFDEPCVCQYPGKPHLYVFEGDDDGELRLHTNSQIGCFTAPTYDQGFKWFREKYQLYTSIVPKKSYPDNYVNGFEFYIEISDSDGNELGDDGVRGYEESQLRCIKRLIEIIKEKNESL